MLRQALHGLLVLSLAATAQAADSKPLMRDFIGINGHFTFKPELYSQVCRLVRNYHNLNWDVKRIGDQATPPMCVNRVNWKDNVYGNWKKGGFETDICLQFNGFGTDNKDYQKLWANQEQWCFDYGKTVAAYFGPSGAEQLCTSFEIGNEPGMKFDSALYKTIFTQMAKGIRAGDPKAKIATPTVQARDGDDYSQDLRKLYADPEVVKLYDIINIHTYSEVPRKSPSECPWNRAYPEYPDIPYLKVIDEAIAWRNQHAKGKEVWVTEFGYDACTEAAMARRKDWSLKLNWQGVSDQNQAQYLVRSFMLFAERDVQRAYIYFFDDNDEPAFHGAAGLTRKFKPKPAFWAVKQLYRTLGDYRFKKVVKQKPGELYVYAFVHGTNPASEIWVAWSPTGIRADRKQGYVPHEATAVIDGLPAQPTRVVGMATADGEAPRPEWKTSADKAITLTVGEDPIYIIMDR